MQWIVWGLLALAILVRWKCAPAWPGLVTGAVLALLGTFGGTLWTWSALNNGSGLPRGVIGDPGATEAFFWAAIGSVLAAITLPKRLRGSGGVPGVAASNWPLYQRYSLAASFTAYVVWLLGQGPSFFSRMIYARTDGIDFFIRLTGFIGPVLGLTALVIGIAGTATKRDKLLQVALGALWFISGAVVGTRMAVAFPLAVLLVFAVTCWRRRSFSSVLFSLFGLYVSTYAALAAFTLSLTVRGQPHGLLGLGALLRDDRIPRFIDPTQWVVAVQLLVSSVTASVPITELSVARAPSARLLLLNANPLPSQFLDLDTFDQERLWPFAWIPLSMVGEWYGATGAPGQVALFFIISLIAAAGVAIGMTSRNPLVVAVVLGLSSIVLVMSIQYPSRSFWRGVSLLILATLIAYFWNKFSASSRGGLAPGEYRSEYEAMRR